jgi:hypothetical protein
MGAIGDTIVAYAQPLIDETDGSEEGLNRALALSQLCWNLAVQPEESRQQSFTEMRRQLEMNVDEFGEFRRDIVIPMIRRHEEMFPLMHGQEIEDFLPFNIARRAPPVETTFDEKYPGTDRYAPCPCDSGRKYKFCCGAKER